MKPLPLLLLSSCIQVHDAAVPSHKKVECAQEMQQAARACSEANVIGTNPNRPLYEAIDAARECIGDIRILCSDTGEVKVLTYSDET